MKSACEVESIPKGQRLLINVRAETRDQFGLIPSCQQIALANGDVMVPISAVDSEGQLLVRVVRNGVALCEGHAASALLDGDMGDEVAWFKHVEVEDDFGLVSINRPQPEE